MVYRTSSTKRIVISFDWHNDSRYRNMLSAWIANPNFPFTFDDLTPSAIDTDSVDRVKAVLASKIRAATHTLVLVGAYANTTHKDTVKIGARNWIWWEIEQSKAAGKGLIAVKIDRSNPTPSPLLHSGATWALAFDAAAIVKAINEAYLWREQAPLERQATGNPARSLQRDVRADSRGRRTA